MRAGKPLRHISKECLCLWVLCCLFSGCVSETATPQIVYIPPNVDAISPLSKVTQNQTIVASEPSWKFDTTVPSAWFPPPELEKRWQAIVIHHSGTASGNSAIFDRWHRERNHWEGVGYDFVIGNGSDSGDGEVEVTFRWTEQKVGAHCKTPGNWANEHAIGICLVGDYDETSPTEQQFHSLIRLTAFLQRRYHIPTNRIYGHNTTPGANITDCPGTHFSVAKIRNALARQ